MERPRDALAEGTELAGYVIGRVLGRGGFAITYFGTDALRPSIKVAIKEFLPHGLAMREAGDTAVHPMSADRAPDFAHALARFEHEARILVALHHPNIVDAQRFIKANGTAYVVMKYEEGLSLGQRLADRATLPLEELRRIVPPLLDGLEAVHRRAFIHRDLKPDNIYLRTDGAPVLLDFGAARQALMEDRNTSLTEIVTPGYAPYEQYDRYSKQGPYTDIYALAATLYRCVSGRRPPDSPARVPAAAGRMPDPMAPARQVGAGAYPRPLLDAIDKGLAVFESDRPQSIAEFRPLLAHALAVPSRTPLQGDAATPRETLVLGETPAAPPAAPPRDTPRPPPAPPQNNHSQRRRGRGIALVLPLLILGGLGYFGWQKKLEEQQALALEEATRAAKAGREKAEAEEKARQQAASDADWTQCFNSSAEADLSISACTREIERGKLSAADFGRAYAMRAHAYFRKKQYRRAQQEYDLAIARDPQNAKYYYSRGVMRDFLEEYSAAILDYGRAIERDPSFSRAFDGRGATYIRMGEPRRAIPEFDRAIALAPSDGQPYFHRGIARLRLNETAAAIRDLKEARRLGFEQAKAELQRLGVTD